MPDRHSYSIDMLKKAAFVDELNNHLSNCDPRKYGVATEVEIVMVTDLVKKYLQERIDEINRKYKV